MDDGPVATTPSTGDEEPDYYPIDENAMSYGYYALDYVHRHLKFPSTMQIIDIRHGVYDRSVVFDGAPDFFKPTNDFLSWNKDYYAVILVIKAANSLGVLTDETYVCLFDMSTGEAWYDLEGYASDLADGAWGSSKLRYMDLKSEALILGAAIRFRSFTQEEIQTLLSRLS